MTRDELARRIADTSVLHGEFTLRSGRTSTWYIDKYRFTTCPEILRELGAMFAVRIPGSTTRLAGAELGGIPLVTAASMASGLPCVFIRNSKKFYGTANQLEGVLEPGDHIVIVEDIATSGGQVLEAAELLVSLGAKVDGIIAVVDRQEGARDRIESAGFSFDSLFTTADLGVTEQA